MPPWKVEAMNTRNLKPTLSELIIEYRGGRSNVDLARDCGGTPSDKRLHQLVNQPMKNFPDPETIRGLARGTPHLRSGRHPRLRTVPEP